MNNLFRVNTSSLYALKKHVEGATIFLEKAKEGARDLNHYYDRSNPLLNPLGDYFHMVISNIALLRKRQNLEDKGFYIILGIFID